MFVDILPYAARERFFLHDIDIQLPIQMIEFVLHNSRIPSFHRLFERFSIFVETAEHEFVVARDIGSIAANAGAAFRKNLLLVVGHLYHWIDDSLQIHKNTSDQPVKAYQFHYLHSPSTALQPYLLLYTHLL